jgi:CHASE3 domain sensor protein
MMPNDTAPSSNLFPIDDSAPKAGRAVWLFAAPTLCVVTAVVAIAVFFAVLPTQRQQRVADAWVQHTHQVITTLNSVLTGVNEAETGQRGFLLTEMPPCSSHITEASIASGTISRLSRT